MDLPLSGASRYQALAEEEEEQEQRPAAAPGPAFPEWSPSPPPYGPAPKAEVPPPYSVATALPSYAEAERAKAAAPGASGEPRPAEDSARPGQAREQLRLGGDGAFVAAFLTSFIFNWVGFCLAFSVTTSVAGRHGALCGFGLSLTKWTLIVRFSDYFTGHFHGQYWLWWLFLLLGLLLFVRGFCSYLRVRSLAHTWAAGPRTRFIFSD